MLWNKPALHPSSPLLTDGKKVQISMEQVFQKFIYIFYDYELENKSIESSNL